MLVNACLALSQLVLCYHLSTVGGHCHLLKKEKNASESEQVTNCLKLSGKFKCLTNSGESGSLLNIRRRAEYQSSVTLAKSKLSYKIDYYQGFSLPMKENP